MKKKERKVQSSRNCKISYAERRTADAVAGRKKPFSFSLSIDFSLTPPAESYMRFVDFFAGPRSCFSDLQIRSRLYWVLGGSVIANLFL